MLVACSPTMLPDDFAGAGETTSRDSLEDAAAYLRRGLRADGPDDGAGDFGLVERQWGSLLQWAEEASRILPISFAPPAREGGREHDVRLEESTGRWIKFTKPGATGCTVSWGDSGAPFMHGASPLEYLQRLAWQNQVFGDDIRLIGLWQAQVHRWSVVTSQPGLQGDRPTLDQLEAAFRSSGFALLPWRGIGYEGSLAFRGGGFDVWDVHPANVFLSTEGLPLPVDVIVTRSRGDVTPSSAPAPLRPAGTR